MIPFFHLCFNFFIPMSYPIHKSSFHVQQQCVDSNGPRDQTCMDTKSTEKASFSHTAAMCLVYFSEKTWI